MGKIIDRNLYGDRKMIKLFVSTFGNSVEKIKRECIPIEVGSANRNNFLYDLHDDSGDTISKDNPYWGELTGLYWIWKNFQFEENDIIGFCHYNKFLKIKDVKIKSFLSENDSAWVVLSRVRIPDHSYPEDVDVLTSVLQKKYPDYYANWSLLYNCIGGGWLPTALIANYFIRLCLSLINIVNSCLAF